MTPAEASLDKNVEAVKKRVDHSVADAPKRDPRKSMFSLGDMVRVSRAKGPFHKGYESGWSVEQFKIIGIIRPNDIAQPLTYRLEDEAGETIAGTFYTEELQKVKYPGIFLVDKVLKERGKGLRKEYFVHWVGYPSSSDSWVKHSDWVFDFSKK